MAQMTTTEFAAELQTDTRTLRKFLRSVTPKEEQPGKGSRWNLPGNKREVGKMKKQFNDWTAAQAKPQPEEPAEIDLVQVTDELLEELDD